MKIYKLVGISPTYFDCDQYIQEDGESSLVLEFFVEFSSFLLSSSFHFCVFLFCLFNSLQSVCLNNITFNLRRENKMMLIHLYNVSKMVKFCFWLYPILFFHSSWNVSLFFFIFFKNKPLCTKQPPYSTFSIPLNKSTLNISEHKWTLIHIEN